MCICRSSSCSSLCNTHILNKSRISLRMNCAWEADNIWRSAHPDTCSQRLWALGARIQLLDSRLCISNRTSAHFRIASADIYHHLGKDAISMDLIAHTIDLHACLSKFSKIKMKWKLQTLNLLIIRLK
jgi:hypothetical protein